MPCSSRRVSTPSASSRSSTPFGLEDRVTSSSARARRMTGALCTVTVALLALAGCAAAPQTQSTASATSDYCARMVTNSGGLDDHSFNQSSWEGLQQAGTQYGIDVQAL